MFKAFCAILLAGCDAFPRDPNGALDEAKDDTLRVGAVSSPPWMMVDNGRVTGVDADLIRGFAESIGTKVEWVSGSESELLPILEHHELHLVAGGLVKATPWKKRVGLTNPYRREKVVVCSTNGGSLPDEIEDLPIGVKKGSSVIAEVTKKEGVPVVLDSPIGYLGLVAVHHRDMKKAGCGPARLTIAVHDHVMAIPKGENGLLMALEEYLSAEGH